MFTAFDERVRQRRARAERELKAVRVASTVDSLALDATLAEVIEQSETLVHEGGQIDAYFLTQIVRNPRGEYFLLKSTDGRPYVKHLNQERARLVLKAKYRPPGEQR